jgi:trehalose 2-sulfotransferase
MYTAHHKFDHVFEGAPDPHRSYFICAVPRSGSSLLCDVLAQTELAGAPTEFFDPNQMTAFRRIWGLETFDQYLEALHARKTSPNGVFGCKVLLGQMLQAFGRDDPRDAFPDLRFVYVTRRDQLRQAVSFARATQTEEWASDHPSRGVSPVFDRDQIDAMLTWIENDEAAWERWFAERGISPLRVEYEQMVDSVEQTVLGVLRFLEVRLPEDFTVGPPTIERQSDELSEQWVARYSSGGSGRRYSRK